METATALTAVSTTSMPAYQWSLASTFEVNALQQIYMQRPGLTVSSLEAQGLAGYGRVKRSTPRYEVRDSFPVNTIR
jgi:hypothetical protein